VTHILQEKSIMHESERQHLKYLASPIIKILLGPQNLKNEANVKDHYPMGVVSHPKANTS